LAALRAPSRTVVIAAALRPRFAAVGVRGHDARGQRPVDMFVVHPLHIVRAEGEQLGSLTPSSSKGISRNFERFRI